MEFEPTMVFRLFSIIYGIKNIEWHRDVAEQKFKNFDRMLFKCIIVSSNVSGGMKVLQKKNIHFILTWSRTIVFHQLRTYEYCDADRSWLFFFFIHSIRRNKNQPAFEYCAFLLHSCSLCILLNTETFRIYYLKNKTNFVKCF